MNKQNIIEKYNISDAKFLEILDGLNISQDTTLFSDEQISLFERVLHLARQQKKSYKQAIAVVTNQPLDSSIAPEQSTALSLEVNNLLQERSTTFAEHILDESPYILKEQRAAARKIIVDSFWNRINELGRSPEFQRKFDAALYGEESLDVSVLPGESSALPESSSSDS
ncbi:hypothetical protein FLX56_26670 [Synechococcus moorigangaii CMS01]|nr:hypothetical protein [Synechococcus moorigangaii CMS01]